MMTVRGRKLYRGVTKKAGDPKAARFNQTIQIGYWITNRWVEVS